MASEKSSQTAFGYPARVRNTGPQACNSRCNYAFPARRPSAHPNLVSATRPLARAAAGQTDPKSAQDPDGEMGGGRGEGVAGLGRALTGKTFFPGNLKAVGLEMFGPVSLGFPAVSDPRDRPRRLGSPRRLPRGSRGVAAG